jgi:DNA replication and repair protein RecF
MRTSGSGPQRFTAMTAAARIRRLTLTNFRNYHAAAVSIEHPTIVLVGPNGAGKTNILEALSFLTPGRGLRHATLEDVAFSEGDGTWAVAAEVEGALGIVTLGTGIDPPAAETKQTTRRSRVDREPVSSVSTFADYLRVLWLVPSMDSLFRGPASDRRRFLDRLVLTIDPEHGARVSALERALRSRNRLLEQPRPDEHWLDAIEHETAELAVAVAAARSQAVELLTDALTTRHDPIFPSAEIALDGWIEALVRTYPAIEIEDRYRTVLRKNRERDKAAGRTLDGVHVTDLNVIYTAKAIAARDASTGEQKALLIGLVLANAELIARLTGFAPILLLDEVVAHLDPSRRAALFDALGRLGSQVWMSGADPVAFGDVATRAQVIVVDAGKLSSRAA